MPFAFTLPTTSSLSFSLFSSSTTHPSLPQTASTYRGIVRNALKRYKRLTTSSKVSNLSTVFSALNEYLPYLFALDAALCDRAVNEEEIELGLQREIVVEWRSTLAATLAGREAPRVKVKGLDFEITFVLHTLACVYTLQARGQLLGLYGATTPGDDQRLSIITTATKSLLQANSIHNYLATRSVETDASSAVIESLSQTQAGLAALALAEATLLAVLKDDPYPSVVAQDRNKNDKEWMIKPPEIPKVRAHLFARLCLAAAEHSSKAEAMLSGSGRVNETLLRYVKNLRKTSSAKACRFFGTNAELEGETGQGIAWLVGAKKQLGFGAATDEGSRMKGLAKFKRDWTERREDRKVERGGDWGSDAGRLEELRVLDMLEQKWNKMNDTINTQLIPPCDPLVAHMPSGRDIYSTKEYVPPSLDGETLARMRAPPEDTHPSRSMENDSSSDSETEGRKQSDFPGALPGSYTTSSSDNAYY